MATKNEDLPWIYKQPATRQEVIKGSKTIGGQAANWGKQNIVDPLVNAGKDIYGGITDTNVRDDEGNLVFNEVTGRPFRQREYNLLGQESFKQSQISNRVNLSDEEALTHELQRLTALSNNAGNDTFASMYTEAAIELQNKFDLYQNESESGPQTTQFKVINALNETKNEVEKAVKVQKETKESVIAPKSDQKDLKSEAQARIDFLSKNTPANKAFAEGDYRKADWDEMRWRDFGKPQYESNLLKKG